MWSYLVPFTSVTVLFLTRALLSALSNYLAFNTSPQFATWFYKMLFQALHFWNHLSVTHDSEMDGQMTYVIRTINISFLTQLLHTVQLDPLSKSLWDINSVSNILYYSHCHLCFFINFISNMDTRRVSNGIKEFIAAKRNSKAHCRTSRVKHQG